MRALIKLILFLLVLAIIAYTVVWFYAASEVKSRLTAFANDSRGSAQSLQFDSVDVKGFPLAFNVSLTNAKAEDRNRGIAWTGPETSGFSISALKPLTVNALMSGKHSIRPAGSSSTQIPFDIDLDAREISVTGGLDKSLKAISLDLSGLTVSNDIFGSLSMEELRVKLDPPTDFGARFEASVDKVNLPQALSAIGTFTDGSATGVVLPKLPKSHKQRHVKAWQRSGGDFIIEEFLGNVDDLKIDGAGNLRLDKDLQLELDLTTYAQGLDELIDRATELGFLQKEQANAVRFGTLMFQRPARVGDGKELVLPLKIESGWVVFGPLKLKKLPAINWPR